MKIVRFTAECDDVLGPHIFNVEFPVGAEVLGGEIVVTARGASAALDVLVPESAAAPTISVQLAAVACGYALPNMSYGLIGRLTCEAFGYPAPPCYLFHIKEVAEA